MLFRSFLRFLSDFQPRNSPLSTNKVWDLARELQKRSPGSFKPTQRRSLGQQAPQGRASYGLGGSSGVSGGPRGRAMGYFGIHFGVHFGAPFGPFWCLDSGAFLDSFRVPPGLHLGSILESFFWIKIEQKVVQETGPTEHVPKGAGGLGQKCARTRILGI